MQCPTFITVGLVNKTRVVARLLLLVEAGPASLLLRPHRRMATGDGPGAAAH